MARSRSIKPGFYKNEHIAECSPMAALMFPGLWMLADKRGILEDRPKKIKAELFAYRDCDVNELLQELQKNGFLERYEVGGVKCIQIINFGKHQRPHPQEPENGLPAKNDAVILKNDSPLKDTASCALTSSSLDPSSLDPVSLSPEATASDKPPAVAKKKGKPVSVSDLTIPATLDNEAGRGALEEWLRYKRRRGSGYTDPKYLSGVLEDYARDGPEALVAAVRFSIGMNYVGLFRPKDDSRGKPKRPSARDGYDPASGGGDF